MFLDILCFSIKTTRSNPFEIPSSFTDEVERKMSLPLLIIIRPFHSLGPLVRYVHFVSFSEFTLTSLFLFLHRVMSCPFTGRCPYILLELFIVNCYDTCLNNLHTQTTVFSFCNYTLTKLDYCPIKKYSV